MAKKIIVSVSNDLVNDQRVDKVCHSLSQMGYELLLVGRRLPHSKPMPPKPFKHKRLNLLFKKGKWFYAELNLRLFFFLLFRRADGYYSNDLDTLLPNTLIAQLKKKKLIYDSHEYFTQVAELVNRPKTRAVWEMIEKYCFPKANCVFTVCESIAELYQNKYNREVLVMRNIPPKRAYQIAKTRSDLGLPPDKHLLILQGTGINIHRGAEELVETMTKINDAVLLIIGKGDVIATLKQMTKTLAIEERVIFKEPLLFDQLYDYTVLCSLGFSLDKNISINHLYALPNKLFDFIRARVPIVASNMVEIAKIIKQYQVGIVLEDILPDTIAKNVNNLLKENEELLKMKENCSIAAEQLCWENECIVLKKAVSEIVG